MTNTPIKYPIKPTTGEEDYNFACYVIRLPNNSPAAPEVTARTNTLLNPTHLKITQKIRFNI